MEDRLEENKKNTQLALYLWNWPKSDLPTVENSTYPAFKFSSRNQNLT